MINSWGTRVQQILDAPPKEITPGEAVSQWIRENGVGMEVDPIEAAVPHIQDWLSRNLARSGGYDVKVAWIEMSMMFDVTAKFRGSLKGDITVGHARIYSEQFYELSLDSRTWIALLEWVSVSLLEHAGRATQGQLMVASAKLNRVTTNVIAERQKIEEEAAVESIKRSWVPSE